MYYNKTQIQKAKEIDIINFLSSEYGLSFKREGTYFRCTDEGYSSLVIKPDRKEWYWNSHNRLHGKGVLDWLEYVEGLSFVDSMKKVIGNPDSYTTENIIEENTKHKKTENNTEYFDENKIPKKADGKYRNVFAYLTKTRHISVSVVTELMKSHRIYQDTRKNAVFTNLDDNGEVGFWCLRGTNTEKKFTRNMSGSNNPYYGFAVDAITECDTLYVFEAPIDLLSHCTISDLKYGKGSWQNQSRIALCGVNDKALECYLPHHKNVRTIKFCLDNDETGRTATQKLMAKYYELGYKTQSITYKCPGKDINEILCNYVTKTKEKSNMTAQAAEKQPTEKKIPLEKAPEEKSTAKSSIPAQTHSSYNYDKSYAGLY